MSIPRWALTGVVLLLVPVLAGCGEDETPEDRPPPSSSPDSPDAAESPSDAATSSATSGGTPTGSGGAAALPPACEVLTPADVEAAFGVPFGEPGVGGGGHAEGDLEWQSDNCDWEAEDLVEVQLALTGPDDFTSGAFTCPQPGDIASTVTPVEVAGATRAWWDEDDAPPLEATLRVCTDAYNLDIELEYEDGVDFRGDPQQQSVALAEAALGVLG